jgi:hypothetical protein
MSGAKRRILAGCGIGCGVLLVAAVVAVVFGMRWFQKTAELPQGDHPLLTGEENLYFTLTLDAEDEGQSALLAHLLQVLGEQDLPEQMATYEKILDTLSSQDPKAVLGQYLPIRYAVLGYPPSGEEAGGGLQSVGLTKSYQFLAWVIGQQIQAGSSAVEDYRGQKLHTAREGGQVRVLMENQLISGAPKALVRRALDRLLDQTPPLLSQEATALGAMVDRTSEETDLWGYITDAPGAFQQMYGRRGGADEQVSAVLGRIDTGAIAADMVSAERARAAIAFRFAGPVEPGDRAGVESAVQAALDTLLLSPLRAEMTGEWPEPRTLLLKGQIEGLAGFLTRQVEFVIQRMRQPRTRPAPPAEKVGSIQAPGREQVAA